MGILAAIREGIRVRLQTVQAAGVQTPRVHAWDARGADLGAVALTIGIPTSSFGRAEPLAPDVEVGRWGWTLTWPIVLYVARTDTDRSTGIVDQLQQEVVEALMSDRTLGGSCLAASIDGATVDDTPDSDTRGASHHIVAWDLTVVRYQNLPITPGG